MDQTIPENGHAAPSRSPDPVSVRPESQIHTVPVLHVGDDLDVLPGDEWGGELVRWFYDCRGLLVCEQATPRVFLPATSGPAASAGPAHHPAAEALHAHSAEGRPSYSRGRPAPGPVWPTPAGPGVTPGGVR